MKEKTKYNTNLASEYYVLSILYRLGLDAYITLGNKKSIDILISKGKYQKTIDVKGVMNEAGWVLGTHLPEISKHHYIVLVRYHAMEDLAQLPECYIIPSTSIEKLSKQYSNRRIVPYTKESIKNLVKYRDWGIIS